MKVNLDGLVASIQESIKGPRARELRFMVYEMARTIRELEAGIGDLKQQNAQLQRELDHMDRKVQHGCTDANCSECDGK